MYLDFHAHASKRGCFIYGNVLDTFEEQVQNQLYCKLIAMNTPVIPTTISSDIVVIEIRVYNSLFLQHFDYEGCLFSKEHMFRIDPGDQAKGLTAGSYTAKLYE